MIDSDGSRVWRKGDVVVGEALRELVRATEKFSSFNSGHEGYAVILEELDELWDEVKKKNPSKRRMRAEAVQVAAMAVRFVLDVCEDGP